MRGEEPGLIRGECTSAVPISPAAEGIQACAHLFPSLRLRVSV